MTEISLLEKAMKAVLSIKRNGLHNEVKAGIYITVNMILMQSGSGKSMKKGCFQSLIYCEIWKVFLVVQMVKCLPATLETQDRSLGWEDPLEKEMATHSSTLAWKIPWTVEPYSPWGRRVGHD